MSFIREKLTCYTHGINIVIAESFIKKRVYVIIQEINIKIDVMPYYYIISDEAVKL